MYKINDYIIYKRDVCIIKELKENYIKGKDYYRISPVNDTSLVINVPTDNPYIIELPSKEEAQKIIESIPQVEEIKSDEKSLENMYKELLATENLLDLVKIIKTTYLRNLKRKESGKKIGDKDDSYFKKAEKYLYSTLSIPLNMTYTECKNYIIDTINNKEVK